RLTEEKRYLDALRKSADYLVDAQEPDGSWRKGNSQFANPSHTTYNSRVGWALILAGQQLDSQRYIEAGRKNMEFTLSQQRENGWFDHNCLSDP
ncbi:MAG: hypothetical protein GWN83_21250, partial [Gemmatimonadetes bacterium]|nr:hypothetical protein [Gemmatimonadota bacterium]